MKNLLLIAVFLLSSLLGFALTPITGADHVCQGSNLSLSNATTGGAWSTSDATKASVSTGGVVTGVAAGTATISYTVGVDVATLDVTVNPSSPITGTSLLCSYASAVLSNATPGGTWSSSNTTVATIGSSSGIIIGGALGTTIISYTTSAGCTALKTVTIDLAPSPIIGSPHACVGSSPAYSNAVTGATWSSSDPAILSIDPTTGVANALSIGTAVITYTLGSVCASALYVTVSATPAITGTTSVCSGSATTLSSTTPAGTWSSSDLAIATAGASSGIVSGVSAGSAAISYSVPGCVPATQTVSIAALPTLSGTTIVPPVCDMSAFMYFPASASPGVTFTWTRSIVAGIANPAATGTGPIMEFLHNTTSSPVAVTYVYTLSGLTCSNTQSITVTVNPSPALTSTLTPPAICDSTTINYIPVSSIPTTSFTWSRATVPGIAALAATGTDAISETLHNVTVLPIAVTYTYTLTAGACSAIQNVTVTVNPTPVLTSTLAPPAICDSSAFIYMPASATPGTSFSWSRDMTTGIANLAATGAGAISEILDNNSSDPVSVDYLYMLIANGCADTQHISLTVYPTPTLSSPLAPPPVCDTVPFSYTPTSATAGVAFSWARAMVVGISNPTSSGIGNPNEVLVNTTTSPVAVTYDYMLVANGCANVQHVTVMVEPCSSALSITTLTGNMFVISPNPVHDQLHISTADKISSITVTNILGQVVLSKNYDTNEVIIDLADLPTGPYFLKLNNTQVIRIIKI